jgi:hypothetical protein
VNVGAFKSFSRSAFLRWFAVFFYVPRLIQDAPSVRSWQVEKGGGGLLHHEPLAEDEFANYSPPPTRSPTLKSSRIGRIRPYQILSWGKRFRNIVSGRRLLVVGHWRELERRDEWPDDPVQHARVILVIKHKWRGVAALFRHRPNPFG